MRRSARIQARTSNPRGQPSIITSSSTVAPQEATALLPQAPEGVKALDSREPFSETGPSAVDGKPRSNSGQQLGMVDKGAVSSPVRPEGKVKEKRGATVEEETAEDEERPGTSVEEDASPETARHEDKKKCSECEITFTRLENLYRHKRSTHSSHPPIFLCNICQKSFTQGHVQPKSLRCGSVSGAICGAFYLVPNAPETETHRKPHRSDLG